ncbi:MAG: Poly(3-hydroxyalkanoate) polymerase subunit PhaC [Steroidobacteraceae bacterium]|nr:Poly(3-hydroxyalkanoate) polymerase subunit PhaC [Steroidobacteraceae bacterium]
MNDTQSKQSADSGPRATATPGDEASELQREFRARLAALTGGLATEEYGQAWWDWFLGLAKAPDRSAALASSAFDKALDNWLFALRAGQPTEPASRDPRFAGDAWNVWPFNVYAHAYSNWDAWWREAVAAPRDLPARSAQLMEFAGRQAANLASPANYLATNPELLEATRAEAGQNLVRGFSSFVDDLQRLVEDRPPAGTEEYMVGARVAVTPGEVILRNRLIEVIQYSPQTATVQAEPILITPAWIMKYYILDLSPHNSFVRYLVERGHTVFLMSWKNPTEADRDLGMDDYVREGFFAALDAVSAVMPGRKVHALGYCIGGTLLTIAAAALAQAGDERLASMTLLAAQADFSEPGELSLFISPQQLDRLEAVMHRAGVLDSKRMGAAFTMLRSQDLLWSPAVKKYLRGESERPNDLMSWNADGTRMPYRMHTEYLTRLYLRNELAKGEFTFAGTPIDLKRITLPMFVVGTETDHVAPWHSVYKLRRLTRSGDYTFLLTSGGHNAGIVTGPQHPKRRFRMRTWQDTTTTLSPEEWERTTSIEQGAWWPAWERWVTAHSSETLVPPPPTGNEAAGYAPLGAAPGEYVRVR